MPRGGDSLIMLIARVGEIGAFDQHSFQSASIFGTEARQIVVAKLVDNDCYHQLGSRHRRRSGSWLRLRRKGRHQRKKNGEENRAHVRRSLAAILELRAPTALYPL